MPIYSISKNQLNHIAEKPFKLEKEIQKLCESNMEQLLGLQFIRTEFALGKFIIDSLAFDPELKAFIIIEYKKVKNFGVVDQGYAYLSHMLNNKADFILEYNESEICKGTLKKKDVDWSQSRVIFVSPSFSKYQRETVNLRDLPIELWEIKRYSNDTVNFSQITADKPTESIKTISKGNSSIQTVNKEVKVYTEEERLEGVSDEIREIYETIKEEVLTFGDDITIHPTKVYIAFRSKKNFAELWMQKNAIEMNIIPKDTSFKDPFGILTKKKKSNKYKIYVKDNSCIDEIILLLKESWKLNS